MTIETRLAEIRARVEKATPGPWENEPPPGPGGDPMRGICVYPKGDVGAVAYVQPLDADVEFIAHSRTDVPWLLDQVELRDKALDAVMELHTPMPIYALAEECEAPEDHEHGTPSDGGDDICWDEPTGDVKCSECRDEWGDPVDHPCPTAQAITAALEVEG